MKRRWLNFILPGMRPVAKLMLEFFIAVEFPVDDSPKIALLEFRDASLESVRVTCNVYIYSVVHHPRQDVFKQRLLMFVVCMPVPYLPLLSTGKCIYQRCIGIYHIYIYLHENICACICIFAYIKLGMKNYYYFFFFLDFCCRLSFLSIIFILFLFFFFSFFVSKKICLYENK